jgi:hypothetical protein
VIVFYLSREVAHCGMRTIGHHSSSYASYPHKRPLVNVSQFLNICDGIQFVKNIYQTLLKNLALINHVTLVCSPPFSWTSFLLLDAPFLELYCWLYPLG